MWLTIPNTITIARVLLIPFFVLSVLYYSHEQDHLRFVALYIFMAASVSDMIDGYIARVFHQQSKAGAILDPMADKLLVLSAFICLYVIGARLPDFSFPIWLVVIVISREVILLVGSVVIHLATGQLKVVPSKWGKATTFFQALSVGLLLLQWPFAYVAWYMAAALTIGSGLDYIVKGIRMLNEGLVS